MTEAPWSSRWRICLHSVTTSRCKSTPTTTSRPLWLTSWLLLCRRCRRPTDTRFLLLDKDATRLGCICRVEELACRRSRSCRRLLVARPRLAVPATTSTASLPSCGLVGGVAARVFCGGSSWRAEDALAGFGVLALLLGAFFLRAGFALLEVCGGFLAALFFAVVVFEVHAGHVAGEDLWCGLACQHGDFGLEGCCYGRRLHFGVPLRLWVLGRLPQLLVEFRMLGFELCFGEFWLWLFFHRLLVFFLLCVSECIHMGGVKCTSASDSQSSSQASASVFLGGILT
jgi:hypothetical protein